MKAAQDPPKTIDEYIALYPHEVQEDLRSIRDEVRLLLPDAEEKISYGIPTFAKGKNLFHFAAFKRHIGLYPGAAAIDALADELTSYKTSKGAIQVPFGQAMPLSLVRKLVRFNLTARGQGSGGER